MNRRKKYSFASDCFEAFVQAIFTLGGGLFLVIFLASYLEKYPSLQNPILAIIFFVIGAFCLRSVWKKEVVRYEIIWVFYCFGMAINYLLKVW